MKNTDLIRIYSNMQTLLSEGSFPGKFGGVVRESLELISDILSKLEQDHGEETGSSGSSVGDAPVAAGLAGS